MVVIGILIALHINNSIIENIDRTYEKEYMASMRIDLQDDISTINHALSGNKDILELFASEII